MTTRQAIDEQHSSFYRYAFYSLFFLLVCRLVSMYFIPLNDTTEARYAEIARKMLETGNWVTPQHDYGVPFWAKPPLSTWLSALSMQWFGVNELAARIPGLLLSIAMLGMVWQGVKRHSGKFTAMAAVVLLAGTLYFYIDAGSVMTDPSLLLCIILAQITFWQAVADKSSLSGYLFFVALGLGLLAKGPVAVVLVGLPIFFWILLKKQWGNLWHRLPWIKGTLLTLTIALPWYIWAEHRTPGFLNYFIIGENISRFLQPGWTGDKYGMAHHVQIGMIWLYALAGIFPWCVFGGIWLAKNRKKIALYLSDQDGWLLYWFLCAVLSLVFFTFARNIIYTYVFPSIPALSILFAEIWGRSKPNNTGKLIFIGASLWVGFIFLIGAGLFIFKPDLVSKTQKPVIALWQNHHPAPDSSLVFWSNKTNFSAQFYAHGRVKALLDEKTLKSMMENNSLNYLIVDKNYLTTIPKEILTHLTRVDSIKNNNENLLLLKLKTEPRP